MEKDLNSWRFRHSGGCGFNFRSPTSGQQHNSNPMVFPAAYADPYGLFRLNSAVIPPINPVNGLSGSYPAQKSFLVFDHFAEKTSLAFSSAATQFHIPNSANQALDLLGSNETNLYNGNEAEEMHEDTEEIDALLYSESDNDNEEEEASTGQSPFDTVTGGGVTEEEQVGSSSVPPLAGKKRRVFDEKPDDPSLLDTASSARARHSRGGGNASANANDSESSWVGNGQGRSKRAKRERIRETVGVLRSIIPGGRGKDAAAVLEEAIRYLRSLKLKAKGLVVAPTL